MSELAVIKDSNLTDADAQKHVAPADAGVVDVRYEHMCRAIDACYRVDEVKQVRDKALALQVYLRQAKNREVERHAIEIRLRAERRAGELMLKQAKAEGTRAQLQERDASGGATVEPPENDVPTLAEQGISRHQAADWQKIATLAGETFEAALRNPQHAPSTASMVKLAAASRSSRGPQWMDRPP